MENLASNKLIRVKLPLQKDSKAKIGPSAEQMGSLSKDDIDDCKNIIWKCNFVFLQ